MNRAIVRVATDLWSPAWVLIALSLGIALFLAYHLNLWLDESYTLHTTGQGISHSFRQALYFELQPPLYFVLLSIWRKLDSSLFFARLPSVICFAMTINVVADLSSRYLKELDSRWVIACVASNPFVIWAAVEVRLYAFAILLSALLLKSFFDGYLTDPPRSKSRWIYLMVSLLALYTQYYLGFLLLAAGCALLLLRRWQSLAAYLRGMTVVAICFAPMVPIVIYQVSAHVPQDRLGDLADLSIFRSTGLIYWIVQEYVLPVGWSQLYFWRRWILRLSLVAFLLLLLTRRGRRLSPEKVAVLCISLILTLCLIAVQRLTAEGSVEARHAVALFVPIILSAFVFFGAVAHRRIFPFWVLLVVLFNGTALYSLYSPVAKTGDWIRVAAHISASEEPSQAILVFHAVSALSLAHYYRGPNPLVPIPNVNVLEQYTPPGSAPLDQRQIAEAVERVSNIPEVWLVSDWTQGFSGYEIDDPVLKRFVEQRYTIADVATFHYSKVFRLRLRVVSQQH